MPTDDRVPWDAFMERLALVAADTYGMELERDGLDWSGVILATWYAHAGWDIRPLFAAIYAVYPEARIVDAEVLPSKGYAEGRGPIRHVTVSFVTGGPLLDWPGDDATDDEEEQDAD